MTLAKRGLSLVLTLLAASIIVFAALDLVPGDVARFMMGVDADPAAVAALREELRLSGSVVERYGRWLAAAIRGDFGVSYTYRVPVSGLIWDRFSVSLPLACLALVFSTGIALFGAIASVERSGSLLSRGILGTAALALAIPNFWLALMLMLVFAAWLQWLPAGGFPGWSDPFGAIQALILPAIALGLPQGAIMLRVLRGALLDVLGQDFLRTARAKGLDQRAALWRHALPNALVPALPIFGLQFAFLIAGAVIVENVFYLPGLGRLVLQAITQRDLVTVKAVIMVLVTLVVLISFLMDMLAARIDPRLRS